LFEIPNDGYRIILIPKVIENKFTELEWEKLSQMAKEKGAVYGEAIDAKNNLKDLTDEV